MVAVHQHLDVAAVDVEAAVALTHLDDHVSGSQSVHRHRQRSARSAERFFNSSTRTEGRSTNYLGFRADAADWVTDGFSS
jgi:hypothetical protein